MCLNFQKDCCDCRFSLCYHLSKKVRKILSILMAKRNSYMQLLSHWICNELCMSDKQKCQKEEQSVRVFSSSTLSHPGISLFSLCLCLQCGLWHESPLTVLAIHIKCTQSSYRCELIVRVRLNAPSEEYFLTLHIMFQRKQTNININS